MSFSSCKFENHADPSLEDTLQCTASQKYTKTASVRSRCGNDGHDTRIKQQFIPLVAKDYHIR